MRSSWEQRQPSQWGLIRSSWAQRQLSPFVLMHFAFVFFFYTVFTLVSIWELHTQFGCNGAMAAKDTVQFNVIFLYHFKEGLHSALQSSQNPSSSHDDFGELLPRVWNELRIHYLRHTFIEGYLTAFCSRVVL